MESKIKATFTSIVMNWIRLNFDYDESNGFPLDIVELIVNIFLYEKVKFLTFSSIFKGDSVILTENNKCAKKGGRNAGGNVYVIPDCQPLKEGIRVWRIKV